jgi:hypothetical protein
MQDFPLLFALIIAFTSCAFYASVAFNCPSWARSYTTAARYSAALAAYVMVYWLTFALAVTLALAIAAVGFDDPRATDPLSQAGLVYGALLLAFCARGLLSRPRRWLHSLAGVPDYATRLSAALVGSDFVPNESVLQEARALLRSRGIECESDWLPPARPAYQQLLRATALFIQLRAWEDDRQFSRFVCKTQNEFNILRRRFERLSFRVARTLIVMERLGEVRYRSIDPATSRILTLDESDGMIRLQKTAAAPGQGSSSPPGSEVDGLMRKIIMDLITEVCEDIRYFYEDASLLAVRGILATQRRRAGRKASAAKLGFVASHPFPNIGYGVLVPTALLLYCGVSLIFLVLPTRVVDLSRAAASAIVSLTSFGAMAVAIVPKLRWGFANTGLRNRTPVAFVLGAGVAAALLAALIQLTAGTLIHSGGLTGGLHRLGRSLPWLPGYFATGSTVAWLVQDTRWLSTARDLRRRLYDALVLGSVWLAAAVAGNAILNRLDLDLWTSASASFLFGSVVGYLIPETIRDRPLLSRQPTYVPLPRQSQPLSQPAPQA